jgi:hypothetical protein
MTKVTILGQPEPEQKELKPMRFNWMLNTVDFFNIHDCKFTEPTTKPKDWDNITLLYRNFFNDFDLFFCWNNNRDVRVLMLGYFNDGVVE